LFLLTVPVAGIIADKVKLQMPGLRITTICSFVFFFLTGFIAEAYPEHYILSTITFMLASYFYLFCYTYYNPLLKDVAIPERHGFASGWGMVGDALGQIFGLLVTLPLATGFVFLWGIPGRAQTLVPAALLFLLFSLPMLIFFKEKSVRQSAVINIRAEYRNVLSQFLKLCALPGVGLFFLAYFFFNDAVATASNNFPIWMDKVMGITGNVQSYLLMAIILTGVIGAPISGWLADKFGFRRVLLWILAGWIVIFPVLALTRNTILFIIVCAVMGLFYGSIWTVTRAYLLHLTPHSVLNQSFTYYTLMERFATFIGPLSWGLAVMYLPKAGAMNYRWAAVIMAVFVLIGYIIARRMPRAVACNEIGVLPKRVMSDLVERHANLKSGIDRIKKIDAGYLSDNYVVVSNSIKYFLKRYRFKERQRIDDAHKAKFFFASKGIPVILPIKNVDSETITKVGDRYYSLFPFVEGRQFVSDGIETPKLAAYSLGQMLGRIHKSSEGHSIEISEKFKPWDKEEFKKVASQIVDIINGKKALTDFDRKAKEAIVYKMERVNTEKLLFEGMKDLRMGLIHGDYHDGNVFFDETGNISYIFDLEKTCIAPYAYEVVRAIQYSHCTGYNRRESMGRTMEFLRGYKTERPMDTAELAQGAELFYQKEIHGL
jgi:UMF1 family MFS transporter